MGVAATVEASGLEVGAAAALGAEAPMVVVVESLAIPPVGRGVH